MFFLACNPYFMECTLDSERKPLFKLSKPLFVMYDNDGMKDMAEKIFGHIIWLLEEAQKPVETSQSDEQMRLSKKQRSSSNLAGKGTSAESASGSTQTN